jgi:hypothetical protein
MASPSTQAPSKKQRGRRTGETLRSATRRPRAPRNELGQAGTGWDHAGPLRTPLYRRPQTTTDTTQLPLPSSIWQRRIHPDVETSSINGPEMSGIIWTFPREPIPVVTILLY